MVFLPLCTSWRAWLVSHQNKLAHIYNMQLFTKLKKKKIIIFTTFLSTKLCAGYSNQMKSHTFSPDKLFAEWARKLWATARIQTSDITHDSQQQPFLSDLLISWMKQCRYKDCNVMSVCLCCDAVQFKPAVSADQHILHCLIHHNETKPWIPFNTSSLFPSADVYEGCEICSICQNVYARTHQSSLF